MTDAKQLIGDIFGSDSESDEGEAPTKAPEVEVDEDEDDVDAQKQRFVSSLEAERSDDEGADDGEGVVHAQKKQQKNDGPPLHMEAPLVPIPGEDVQIKQFKLSNILGVNPNAFDPQKFVEGNESSIDEFGNRSITLHHNTIRWRWARDPETGELKRESNARFVRWSDGTQQLMIGDEVLDIAEQDTGRDCGYLYIRHAGLIQAQCPLNSKMTFRPSSLQSKSHKNLTAKMDRAHAKTDKLRLMLTTVDPIKEKEEREKLEEQRNKDKMELLAKQEKELERGGYYDQYSGGGGRLASFLEHEDDGMDADEDDREEEEARVQRILDAKRQVPDISRKVSKQKVIHEEEEEEEEQDSDDDAPVRMRKRARNVVMDADDSD